MPLDPRTKVFGVKECRVAKMLTDPAGGAATYGSTVSVPGIKKLTLTGTIKTSFLRGDNTLLDSDAVWENMTGVFDNAKLSLDVMSVFFSTVSVGSGTTPNQLNTFTMKNTDTLNYFKADFRCVSADTITGDVEFTLWKCKLGSYPSLGLMEEDYQIVNQNIVIVPRLADNFWLSIIERETAVALS